MNLICSHCGNPFERKRKSKGVRAFCSNKCYQQAQSDSYTVIRHAFRKSENRAKRKNLDFDLTIEYAKEIWDVQDKTCSLSGLKIDYADSRNDKRHGKNTASIDRIDSGQGYIIGNIQYIYKDLQDMKGAMPEDMFIFFCRRIAEHTKDRVINWAPPGLDMGNTSSTIMAEATQTESPRFDAEFYTEAF